MTMIKKRAWAARSAGVKRLRRFNDRRSVGTRVRRRCLVGPNRVAKQEGVVVASIDLEYQHRVGHELPALKQARLLNNRE